MVTTNSFFFRVTLGADAAAFTLLEVTAEDFGLRAGAKLLLPDAMSGICDLSLHNRRLHNCCRNQKQNHLK